MQSEFEGGRRAFVRGRIAYDEANERFRIWEGEETPDGTIRVSTGRYYFYKEVFYNYIRFIMLDFIFWIFIEIWDLCQLYFWEVYEAPPQWVLPPIQYPLWCKVFWHHRNRLWCHEWYRSGGLCLGWTDWMWDCASILYFHVLIKFAVILYRS